jgi:hypothetical protein
MQHECPFCGEEHGDPHMTVGHDRRLFACDPEKVRRRAIEQASAVCSFLADEQRRGPRRETAAACAKRVHALLAGA